MDEVADALAQDSVLVHELHGEGSTVDVDADLTALAAEVGVPVYIALVAHPDDLPTDQPADELVRLLHLRLDEPGLYLAATDAQGLSWAAYDVEVTDTAVDLAVYGAQDELMGDGCCLTSAGEAALTLQAAADGDISGSELDAVRAETYFVAAPDNDEWIAWEPDPWRLYAFPIALALVAGLATYAVARSWRRPKAPAPALATATATAAVGVQRSAVQREVRALARKVGRARADRPGHPQAAECLAQAEGLLSQPDELSLVGALTLARTGTRALVGGAPYRCCFFDPLHGEATARTTSAGVSVPCCTRCRKDADAGRAPDSLTVQQRWGRRRPYWQQDSVWSRTGFGSLVDDYVDQVREAPVST